MIEVTLQDTDLPAGHYAKGEGIDILEQVIQDVVDEFMLARNHFPPFFSKHDGVAIIEEEFLEFRDAVFWPHREETGDANEEVKQLAAMSIRYLTDIAYTDKEI